MDGMDTEARTCFIGGLPFQALAEPDLKWLSGYGQVFRVIQPPYSGNLCFGVAGRYGRLFVKYAGALTPNARCGPREAADILRSAMPLYDPPRPGLTRLLSHGPVGDGYAAVFAWRDAPALRSVPDDPAVRAWLRRLPLADQLAMLDQVFSLHAALAGDGLISSDFHDGNVLIDFVAREAVVCDIDLYRRKPAVNVRGRVTGVSHFMAPEEYQQGAALDEATTVYHLGALAFAVFGMDRQRSADAWLGPRLLFDIASRAVQDKKTARYPSVQSFLDAWRAAVGRCRL